ncbi:MAG: glucose 1-dehydrogenase [Sphingosinicella sp.]|nr:glucose 1-dehydrogenase [Sphingosinicella sp.]
MRRFEGKVVVITGGARGIGLASAERFAREGAVVVITDVLSGEVEAQAARLSGEGLAVEAAVQDVTREADWDRLVADVIHRHGRLDVLVNNAGIARIASIEESSLADWRLTMAVNVEGVFLGAKAAIGAMKERGGAIVNIASIAGNVGEPLLAAYNASKGAVKLLTRNAALHCARHGYPIRVNSMHPGYTDTLLVSDAIGTMEAEAGAAFAAETLARIPIGRFAVPDEIAGPILFLASDDARYMTGSELIVDGGYTAA